MLITKSMVCGRPKDQGDLLIIEVSSIPAEATPVEPINGQHIVAHSETGHHHYVDAAQARYYRTSDPQTCYLRCEADLEVRHNRAWDTHAPIALQAGKTYLFRRQVESRPEGWRTVQD